MTDDQNCRSRLRVIPCEECRSQRIGKTRILVSPKSALPLQVQAVVEEEDTHLVLSADNVVRARSESLEHLTRQMVEDPPRGGGAVVVRASASGRPLRFLAVVHDLDQEPSCREEWVAEALYNVFEAAEKRRVETLALPVLGSVHGRIQPGAFLQLMVKALDDRVPDSLRRLFLLVPRSMCREVAAALGRVGGRDRGA